MPTNGNYTENFRILLTEVRRYLGLQKSYVMLDMADKLTVLLSTIAIAAICFVLGAIILFFLTFALALWIGRIMGNSALGFLCIAVVLAVLTGVAWCKRNEWIIQPLARLMARIFYNKEVEDDQEPV